MTTEQARYQVRFDWGYAGAAAIADDADVVVWVDAIATAAADIARIPGAAVIAASLPSAAAAAQWIVALQQQLARRIVIAIIAAGEPRGDSDRFAVEDLLAAGSVIDQLATLGLDATSPEAAAAEGAFKHLSRAVSHLLTASVTAGIQPPDRAQLKLDPSLTVDDVEVLRQHPEL
jgi:phosphosulfolactate phosphohydrolase-like enzyme